MGSTAFRAISRPFLIERALEGPLLLTVRAAERVARKASPAGPTSSRLPPKASNGLEGVGVGPKTCKARVVNAGSR
jgi:hypothetical protein